MHTPVEHLSGHAERSPARMGWIWALLIVALMAAACSSGDGGSPDEPGTSSQDDRGQSSERSGSDESDPFVGTASEPLGIELSEPSAASPSEATPEENRTVNGDPLDTGEIDGLFDRLEPIAPESDDRADFNRPADRLEPPRIGATLDTAFPPAGDRPGGGPDTPDDGPLEVVRVQPEGDVDIAPFISITFNQPMVPVATLDQLEAADLGIELSPDIDGEWKWLGTKTVRFEHDSEEIDRLPMATEFEVTIPAATTSATGGELEAARTFSFTTPTVQLETLQPQNESIPTEPVFVATFDQRIDPETALDQISLTAGGDTVEVRLATDADLEADEDAKQLTDDATEGRWIAFRPVDALATATEIEITFGPGLSSAEGPRTSDEATTRKGSTYSPLEITRASCGFGTTCSPGSSFDVTFNNQLDEDLFDPDLVSVEPEPAGLRIDWQGSGISIRGATEANTEYSVTIDGGLTDVFGQTLGEDDTRTFDVGEARPRLINPNSEFGLVTLDPLTEGQFYDVETVNHDELEIALYRVQPSDWATFAESLWEQEIPTPPGELIERSTLTIEGPDDRPVATGVDLAPALGGEPGHVVVLVETTLELSENDDDYWENRPYLAWVQSTQLATDTLVDPDEIVTWTTDLGTGAPVEGASVTLDGAPLGPPSDADGLSTAELPATTPPDHQVLLATKGDDTVLLPTWGIERQLRFDQGLWYVIDDRTIVRPGEDLRVKGWVRTRALRTDASLKLPPEQAKVEWTALDSVGNELATGEAEMSALGGFDLEFSVPEGANSGMGWVQMRAIDSGVISQRDWTHEFSIQDFRRPEFEVSTEVTTPAPHVTPDPVTVTAQAEYFAGGPLPDAAVEWVVSSRTTNFVPPGQEAYSFGITQPWWSGGDFAGDGGLGRGGFTDECFDCGPGGFDPEKVEQFTGRTDASGNHAIQLDFDGDGDGQPTSVSASAEIQDVNRQRFSSTSDLLVHPADRYVGIRSTTNFVKAGQPLVIEAIAVDLDGDIDADRPLTIELGRVETVREGGEWTEEIVDPETCEVDSGPEPVECTFSPSVGGQYRVTATVTDAQGRTSSTQIQRWVAGETQQGDRSVTLEELILVPDAEEYAPGDTAEVLLNAPFTPATALISVTRNGIVSTETLELTEPSEVIEVPLTSEHIPGVSLEVELVGSAPRVDADGEVSPDAPPRPAYAAGAVQLAIPPAERTLAVDVTPDETEVMPGTDTEVTVTVTDAAGAGVAGAELAVIVVDEALLALSGYEFLDPTTAFYQPVAPDTDHRRARDHVLIDDPTRLERTADFPSEGGFTDGDDGEVSEEEFAGGGDAMLESASAGAMDDSVATSPAARSALSPAQQSGGDPDAIELRSDFEAVALFAPEVTTDANGTATVEVPIPDSLTRYRVMVAGVDGADQMGSGSADITARLPLLVRPSAPRFLNFGDGFEFPVVVQNQTEDELEVDLAIRTSNLELTDTPGRRVTVPADDRVEVRFGAETDEVGTARFQVVATSGELSDAASGTLPVYTPATTEAFATYGVIDEGATAQPLLAPVGVETSVGGLEVTTSSTAVQALTDAVGYLSTYPFANADGVASRILAVVALSDVLEVFETEGLPDPAVLDAAITDDITALVALQNNDGGFATWQKGRPSDPFRSIQATHALIEARDAERPVPPEAISSALTYIGDIESTFDNEMIQVTKDALSSYALHVRSRAGDRDEAKAADLYERRGEQLPLDALAWLWPALADGAFDDEIERRFQNQATETAGAAAFTSSYDDDAHVVLASDRRTDGIVLGALVSQTPDSDLIPKVAAGLLSNRERSGRWGNVQENSFILVAMKDYFDTFEDVTPDFVARVWLGDLYAGEAEFSGRSIDRSQTLISTAELTEQGDTDLVLSKEGAGRLYYRIGLDYSPESLELDPLDRGFEVTRTYQAVDDTSDVRQDEDGTWIVKAGARVRVKLAMVADQRHHDVALVDPLPAGLEPVNPDLATTAPLPIDPDLSEEVAAIAAESGLSMAEAAAELGVEIPAGVQPGQSRWWEHQNLTDSRAEAIAGFLQGGVYDWSYVALATTPGSFVVPPATAEEIYAPETFGRSASAAVRVVEQ